MLNELKFQTETRWRHSIVKIRNLFPTSSRTKIWRGRLIYTCILLIGMFNLFKFQAELIDVIVPSKWKFDAKSYHEADWNICTVLISTVNVLTFLALTQWRVSIVKTKIGAPLWSYHTKIRRGSLKYLYWTKRYF